MDWQSLKDWSEYEQPIVNPSQDIFSRFQIAKRVAGIIVDQKSKGKEQTFGLLSDFGGGKTSIINLIEYALSSVGPLSDASIVFSKTSCWGFDDSAAALEHILSHAIEALGPLVDCTAIRGLSRTYRLALSPEKGWWGIPLDLFGGEHEPSLQLQRLIPVLKATNLRLVLAIEDVDRNPGATFDPTHILATLNRLKDIQNVSFIITTSFNSGQFVDHAKLCDHIEIIPPLEKDSTLHFMKRFRDLLAGRSNDIDPLPSNRRDLIVGRVWGLRLHERTLEPYHPMLYNSILKLVYTPRKLKHLARSTVRCWEKIHGEVDLDELLIVNILRHCAPEAFNFLLQNMDLLRIPRGSFLGDRNNQGPSERQKEIAQDWTNLGARVTWDQDAAVHLITFLVPSSKEFLTDKKHHEESDAPQGVRHTHPVDYWRRLLAEALNENDISDQEVLVERLKWSHNQLEREILAGRLYENERFAALWEHFDEANPSSRLLELADGLFQIILDREGANASVTHVYGATVVWHRAPHTIGREKASTRWLKRNVIRAVRRSLNFANDLYYYWASANHGIVPSEDRDKVRKFYVGFLKHFLKHSTTKQFVGIIGDSDPRIIRELIFPSYGNDVPQSTLSDPSDWVWIGKHLLAATNLQPEKMMPQLILMIGKTMHLARTSSSETVVKYEIDHDLVETMFGQRKKELMTLLTKQITVPKHMFPEFVERAREEAARWLSKNSKN